VGNHDKIRQALYNYCNFSNSVEINREESWTMVNPDETLPFTFQGREKSRHRDTHKVRVHQVVVKVGIWDAVNPVSIDKVGVFFRHAPPLPELMVFKH